MRFTAMRLSRDADLLSPRLASFSAYLTSPSQKCIWFDTYSRTNLTDLGDSQGVKRYVYHDLLSHAADSHVQDHG